MRSSSRRSSALLFSSITGVALFAITSSAFAEQHTAGVPIESSRPGALYTVFIDPAGFNYPGQWAGGSTPGNNLAINKVPADGTFSSDDVTEIKAIYASLASKYRSFNVNVTTVDPAIAGLAAQGITNPTDAQRVAYYDSQAHMMHTIVGPGGNDWHGGADGLAAGDISTVATGGGHTNWMFTEQQDGTPTVKNGEYIGGIDAHETGHTFGLNHQSDFAGTVKANEYTDGDATGGNGSYTAIMGGADNGARQRVTWRSGYSNGGSILSDDPNQPTIENQQNDVQKIASNNGVTYVSSLAGHSLLTATPLPIVGNQIDVNSPLHAGQINPKSLTSPVAKGSDNYTTDFYSFVSNGVTPITLSLNDGDDLLKPGEADSGITLRSILSLYNSPTATSPFMVVPESVDTLSSTLLNQILAAGTYYAQVSSFGGHDEISGSSMDGTFNAAQYFDMGGYFFTGSGFVVPEPTSFAFLALGAFGMTGRRRKA